MTSTISHRRHVEGGTAIGSCPANLSFGEHRTYSAAGLLASRSTFRHAVYGAQAVANDSYRVLQPGGSIRIASSNLGGQGWLDYLARPGFSDVGLTRGYATGARL